MAHESDVPLPRCRKKLEALGLPYPKSNCEKCGSILVAGWRCPVVVAEPTEREKAERDGLLFGTGYLMLTPEGEKHIPAESLMLFSRGNAAKKLRGWPAYVMLMGNESALLQSTQITEAACQKTAETIMGGNVPAAWRVVPVMVVQCEKTEHHE